MDEGKYDIAMENIGELSNVTFHFDKIIWNEINDLITNTNWIEGLQKQ